MKSGSVPSTISPHECNPDPYVKLIFPNGEEDLEQNKTYGISWKSQKVNGNVKIELMQGGAVIKTLADSESNDGEFSWSVGSDIDLGNNYKIKITSISDPLLTDESDVVFSVIEEFIPDYFLMPSGTDNVITVIDTLFYDDQGEAGDYSTNFSGEVILKPGRSDKKVKIEFLDFSIEDSSSGKIWDTLNIYNGEGTSDLIGRWFGDNNPGTIISGAPDGALTVTFNSDEATEGSGWKAHVTLETVTSLMSIGNTNSQFGLSFTNGMVCYNLPEKYLNKLSFNLYSLKGRKIGSLSIEQLTSGSNYVALNKIVNTDLAKGVYILSVESGSLKESLHIVLK